MNNPGAELMPLDPQDISIVNKITGFVEKNGLEFLHKSILPRSLFGIESSFVEENPSLVRPLSDNALIDYEHEIKVFTNDKAGKSGRAQWYIAPKSIIKTNQKYINEWKVVVSSANAGGQKRDNQLEIIDNHSAFGRSRVALKSFKTSDEANNFYKYVKSFTIRFAFLMTDEALSSLGKKVPDLKDYSNQNSLLDFHLNIDEQLSKLMGFSEEEKTYIRERVETFRSKKEMD